MPSPAFGNTGTLAATFMNILLFKIFFFTSSITQLNNIDTLNVEQIAFNVFISRIDSFVMYDYSDSKYFQKTQHHIYFSGKTSLHSSLPFAINQITRKLDFIIVDSLIDLKPGKIDGFIH